MAKLDCLHVTLITALFFTSIPASWWFMDNRVELLDRTPPYTRTPDKVVTVDANTCGGLPDGPLTDKIRVGDCLTAKWFSVFNKTNCRAWPPFPYVDRRLTDSAGSEINLPLIPSQFSPGVMNQVAGPSLGNKVFRQPQVALGEVQYNTVNMRYVCTLKSGMDNPVDWILPRVVTSGPIRYVVSK